MPLRRPRLFTFKATGVSDTVDATNLGPGKLTAATNLVPAPNARGNWLPRQASTLLVNLASSFTTPNRIEVLFATDTRIYGLVQTARFAGKSEPFIYDLNTAAFIAISGVTSANTPTSTANTGDWTPPTAAQVGGYMIFTHPGFNFAGGQAFGWLDMTGATPPTKTGDTHSNTSITNLATNVITAGWTVGMLINSSNGDIPANTYITAIAAGGLSLTLSQAATGTNAGGTLTVVTGSFAAPRWVAGNTNLFPLANLATAVEQYAGSACFAVNTNTSSAVVFSDAGAPLSCTNANQTVTFGNSLPVTALIGQGFYTQTGGVALTLLAFQGSNAIQQLAGTPILSNLTVSTLNDSVGTLSPNSIAQTPNGILFAAPDGLRLINLTGLVTPVIGEGGEGITTPFIFASFPSRTCGAYQESVYRISVNNGAKVGVPREEYWLHTDLGVWSGPHSFPADLVTGLQTTGNPFVMAPSGIAAEIFQSSVYPPNTQTASFIENGLQMTFTYITALLPDTQQMNMNALVETAIAVAVPSQQTINFAFTDEVANTIGTATLAGPLSAPTIWHSFNWGGANWGAGATFYAQQIIRWPAPITFKQGQITITGNLGAGLDIGNLYLRYQELSYVLPTTQGAI